MDLTEKIEEYLTSHYSEMIEDICSLVQIPLASETGYRRNASGKDQEEQLLFCSEIAEDKGLFTKQIRHFGTEVRLGEQPRGQRLTFAAHVDVLADHMKARKAKIPAEGDSISREMELMPLIAVLYAMAFYRDTQIELKNDFRLFIGTQRESGMEDLKYYLNQEGQPAFGIALEGETAVSNGEMGRICFRIRGKKQPFLREAVCMTDADLNPLYECRIQTGGARVSVKKSAEVSNPVRGMLMHYSKMIFEDSVTADAAARMAADIAGMWMGIEPDDGGVSCCLYDLYLKENEVCYELELAAGAESDLEVIIKKMERYMRKSGLRMDVLQASPGYYVGTDEGIPSILKKVYEMAEGRPAETELSQRSTYAGLFQKGCCYSTAGRAVESDETCSMKALRNAVKHFILVMEEIDSYWGE